MVRSAVRSGRAVQGTLSTTIFVQTRTQKMASSSASGRLRKYVRSDARRWPRGSGSAYEEPAVAQHDDLPKPPPEETYGLPSGHESFFGKLLSSTHEKLAVGTTQAPHLRWLRPGPSGCRGVEAIHRLECQRRAGRRSARPSWGF